MLVNAIYVFFWTTAHKRMELKERACRKLIAVADVDVRTHRVFVLVNGAYGKEDVDGVNEYLPVFTLFKLQDLTCA